MTIRLMNNMVLSREVTIDDNDGKGDEIILTIVTTMTYIATKRQQH